MPQEQSVPRSGFRLFAVGAVIGAGLALLYAPQSGKETRKLLTKKAKLIRDKVQVTVENAQEIIKDGQANIAAAFDSGKEIAQHNRP